LLDIAFKHLEQTR